MESSFRLADAVNSLTPHAGTHHDLGCKVILTIAIRVFLLLLLMFLEVHLKVVHNTVTPPPGS